MTLPDPPVPNDGKLQCQINDIIRIIYVDTQDAADQQSPEFLVVGNSDCNFNSVADNDDIVSEFSLDCNGNCVPDECEFPGCPDILLGDMNCDDAVNGIDLQRFVEFFIRGGTCQADIDQNGRVDSVDVALFVEMLLGL